MPSLSEQQHIELVVAVCTALLGILVIIFLRRLRRPPPLEAGPAPTDEDEDDSAYVETDAHSASAAPLPVAPGEDPNDLAERKTAITNVLIGCYFWFYLLVFGALGGIGLLLFQLLTGSSVSEVFLLCSLAIISALVLVGLVKRRLPFQEPEAAPRERDLSIITVCYVTLSGIAYLIHPDRGLLYFVVGINAFLVYMLVIYFLTRSLLSRRIRGEALLPAVAPALECAWLLSKIL